LNIMTIINSTYDDDESTSAESNVDSDNEDISLGTNKRKSDEREHESNNLSRKRPKHDSMGLNNGMMGFNNLNQLATGQIYSSHPILIQKSDAKSTSFTGASIAVDFPPGGFQPTLVPQQYRGPTKTNTPKENKKGQLNTMEDLCRYLVAVLLYAVMKEDKPFFNLSVKERQKYVTAGNFTIKEKAFNRHNQTINFLHTCMLKDLLAKATECTHVLSYIDKSLKDLDFFPNKDDAYRRRTKINTFLPKFCESKGFTGKLPANDELKHLCKSDVLKFPRGILEILQDEGIRNQFIQDLDLCVPLHDRSLDITIRDNDFEKAGEDSAIN
jgi:hypothetical protein